MPNLTATGWLQAGLIFILLVLLALSMRRRWHRARLTRNHYRTANGRDIEAQSRAILQLPMATRRVRAGAYRSAPVPTPHSMPSALHLVSGQRKHLPGYGPGNQASVRGTAAALYDMGHGGKRQASPYTVGSVEHSAFMTAYNLAYQPKSATVQTSAQSAEEPAAA